jgi:elongation factor 1 alpha-like protein
MVVLGHVDAGKSTLMGQLLVQVGQVSKRDAQKQQNLSWLLDENESERQRGVTMELATKSFALPRHDLVILDAPGHADFIPIMITGAAQADVAILVVAAVRGEFEAGFDLGKGQTREHVLLARGLGVSQVIVAINKLDVEGWSQERYREIKLILKEYLLQQQFAPKRIRFVPLSGLTGENVKDKRDPQLLAWYKGPTLLEAIDGFQPANRHVGKSTVLSSSRVVYISYCISFLVLVECK